MNDDLVKRLPSTRMREMKARIEELEARNRELALQVIASEGQAQEAYERQVELEAKLSRAVEALNFVVTLHESKAAKDALKDLGY